LTGITKIPDDNFMFFLLWKFWIHNVTLRHDNFSQLSLILFLQIIVKY
jgi:hypothetical protein